MEVEENDDFIFKKSIENASYRRQTKSYCKRTILLLRIIQGYDLSKFVITKVDYSQSNSIVVQLQYKIYMNTTLSHVKQCHVQFYLSEN